MYKVQFSPLAKEDLLKLKNYLLDDFDEVTADNAIGKLVNNIKNIEEYPLLGRPLANKIDIPTEYMYYVADKNYVFYRLENKHIKVIRILDTRQDYIQLLFDE